MNILVTGGSGFIGTQVVHNLVSAGHRVRLLTRGTRALPPQTESVRGSVLDPLSLNAAMIGCDAVIHLVGIISEVGDQSFERVHAEGTATVVRAMQAARIPRLIHMSALGARPDSPARYQRSKAAGEEFVRQSGLAWTIFRPSLVFGPGDGFVTLFNRISRWSPIVPVMGSGAHLLQPIDVASVAWAFADAVGRPELSGKTLDLCGPDRLSFRQIIDVILSVTHRRRWVVSIPWPVAWLQAGLLEVLFPAILRQAPPLNRDQLRMLQEDNVGDPDPAFRLMGIHPLPFREGVRWFLTPREHRH